MATPVETAAHARPTNAKRTERGTTLNGHEAAERHKEGRHGQR